MTRRDSQLAGSGIQGQGLWDMVAYGKKNEVVIFFILYFN